MKNEEGVLGIVSFVFGILSIVFSLSVPINSILIGIIGLIFGLIDRKKGSSPWGRRGMWLNIIGIVLGILSIIVAIKTYSYIQNNPNILGQLQGAQ